MRKSIIIMCKMIFLALKGFLNVLVDLMIK